MSLPDNDIFTGPITLEEVKLQIKCNQTFLCRLHQTIACVDTCSEDSNESLHIIETHSTPNLRAVKEPNVIEVPKAVSITMLEVPDELHNTQDSLLSEKIVLDSSLTPENIKMKKDTVAVDVTFSPPDKMAITEEFSTPIRDVPLIINPQNSVFKIEKTAAENQEAKIDMDTVHSSILPLVPEKPNNNTLDDIIKIENVVLTEIEGTKNDVNSEESKDSHIKTTIKGTNSLKVTPDKTGSQKKTIFKTPRMMIHKNFNVSPSPSKKLFPNIVSPVACYIKSSPIVPLVQNVRPRKPIQEHSNIPKLIKSVPTTSNKKNVNLPNIAYRSAKDTQVINCLDNRKVPQSDWAKKISSSQRKAVVMKHSRRVNTVQQPSNLQEDSFRDLPMHQADLSVCTKKYALNNH